MWARLEQGHLALAEGNPQVAQVALLDAVRACHAVGDQAVEAEALAAMGDTYRALGDNGQAGDFYRAGALGYAAVQEPWREAVARARLAECLDEEGKSDAARAEREAALGLIANYDDAGITPLRRELKQALEG
jgi:hypothetical protein